MTLECKEWYPELSEKQKKYKDNYSKEQLDKYLEKCMEKDGISLEEIKNKNKQNIVKYIY